MTETLLSTAAVAARLGLSPESVLRRFRRGELAGYRLASNVLRFRAHDIDTYLEARREHESFSTSDFGGTAPLSNRLEEVTRRTSAPNDSPEKARAG